MKTSTRVVATAVVAGGIGLGSLALVAPAVAQTLGAPLAAVPGSPGGGYGQGRGMGAGMGYGARGGGVDAQASRGNGMGGRMMGTGNCAGLSITAQKGSLTEAQRAALVGLAQEEKLAHDLYAAFAGKYDAMVFDHIAAAETQHLTALRTIMERYGVSDPTKDTTVGKFSDPAVQASYDQLLASGSGGEKAAFDASKRAEQADIDSLGRALNGLSAPDAQQVYTYLVDASKRHLAAFDRWGTR